MNENQKLGYVSICDIYNCLIVDGFLHFTMPIETQRTADLIFGVSSNLLEVLYYLII